MQFYCNCCSAANFEVYIMSSAERLEEETCCVDSFNIQHRKTSQLGTLNPQWEHPKNRMELAHNQLF